MDEVAWNRLDNAATMDWGQRSDGGGEGESRYLASLIKTKCRNHALMRALMIEFNTVFVSFGPTSF